MVLSVGSPLALVRFQPSELVKVAIPMMVAWLLVVDAGRPDLKKNWPLFVSNRGSGRP